MEHLVWEWSIVNYYVGWKSMISDCIVCLYCINRRDWTLNRSENSILSVCIHAAVTPCRPYWTEECRRIRNEFKLELRKLSIWFLNWGISQAYVLNNSTISCYLLNHVQGKRNGVKDVKYSTVELCTSFLNILLYN